MRYRNASDVLPDELLRASLLHQPWNSDRLLQLASQHGLGPLLSQHLGAQNAVPVPVKECLRSE